MHGIKGLCQLGSAEFYYYRRPIPEKLRPYVGKGEYVHSLRTRDKALAIRLALDEEKKVDALVAEAQAAWRAEERRKVLAGLTPTQEVRCAAPLNEEDSQQIA